MNSRLILLLALAAGLLFLAFRKPAGAAPSPVPGTARQFTDGQRVRLVVNPSITGTVGGAIWDPERGWLYKVFWDGGQTTFGLAEQFLEASIGPQPA